MRVDLATGEQATREDFSKRVRLPKRFAAAVNAVLQPGTTVMVTDRPATPDTRSDPGFVVMQTEPPAGAGATPAP
jgi:hypothetical protein